MPSNGFRREIEHRLTNLEAQVETILQNHLPHLEESIRGLNSRLSKQDKLLWGIFLLLVGSMVGLIFDLIKHRFI
jgi:hypothetical protein